MHENKIATNISHKFTYKKMNEQDVAPPPTSFWGACKKLK